MADTEGKRIVIVGGVAGGASAAARARRLCEKSSIVVLDKGPYVSFANCGLPYYVGDVIPEERSLLVASQELFRERFAIETRTRHEVLSIDREAKEVVVRALEEDREYREPYDALVLAPGARAIRPPIPGIDRPGIFVLRTIPDSRKIRAWLQEKQARRAVVVGGGFIGLEMAENLVRRGLSVTVIEMAPQLMPSVDSEMAAPLADRLRTHGVEVVLGDGVASFEQSGAALTVRTAAGAGFDADLVILAIGVRPETGLAAAAGLDIGERGGIAVDERMQTNDPSIWAVGDAVEVPDVVTGARHPAPLAGPANRQGRIAADAIFGRASTFRGVQSTAVCGAFGLTLASTGASERVLKAQGRAHVRAVYLHPGHHVGYYPGAKPIHMKVLYDGQSGRLLGAQAIGEEGVARRVDVIAMALQMGGTVYDLEEAELCYAPQFGAAKDPVNLAGMVAANSLRGDHPTARWEDLPQAGAVLVDVRRPAEFAAGHVEGAISVPLEELRERHVELPRDKPVWVYCRVGQRGYYAVRLLVQHGVDARNLLGGYVTRGMLQ